MPDPIGPGARIGGTAPTPQTPAASASKTVPAAKPAAPVAAPSAPKIQPGTVIDPHAPGTFSYTTTVKIAARPEEVMKALQGDWNKWWAGGLQTNAQHTPDGHYSFDLAPVDMAGVKPINVHVKIAPPVAEPLGDGQDGFKVILPTHLTGNFEGECHFTILQAPDGGTYLQSTWKDMQPHGAAKLMGDAALKAHFAAENNALANLERYLQGKPTETVPQHMLHKLF